MRLIAAAVLMLGGLSPVGAAPGDDGWPRLQETGIVVFLRHAQTGGGVGDPPGFRVEDCTTQRNLSADGRAQAQRLGDALRSRKVNFDRVLSSEWCRCLDTARIATGVEPDRLPALNNFFAARDRGPPQVAELRKVISGLDRSQRILMVSHGVVISALTGASLAEGEMLIVKLDARGLGEQVGRIAAP